MEDFDNTQRKLYSFSLVNDKHFVIWEKIINHFVKLSDEIEIGSGADLATSQLTIKDVLDLNNNNIVTIDDFVKLSDTDMQNFDFKENIVHLHYLTQNYKTHYSEMWSLLSLLLNEVLQKMSEEQTKDFVFAFENQNSPIIETEATNENNPNLNVPLELFSPVLYLDGKTLLWLRNTNEVIIALNEKDKKFFESQDMIFEEELILSNLIR